MLIQPVYNLRFGLTLCVHRKDGSDGFCTHWVNLILAVVSYLITKHRASHSDTVESVLFHTSLDTPGKVLAVILCITLEDGFKNDSLRGVRHWLFGVENLHTVAFELCFVNGTVVPVPGEAVKGVHNHSVKMPLLAVLDKPLEARSIVRLAGYSPVNVFVYDNKVVLEGKLVTFTKLSFDGFFSLIVARVTSIYYRFDSLTSNIFFLCINSNGMSLSHCRSCSLIPLKLLTILKFISHRHELMLCSPGQSSVDTKNVFLVLVGWFGLG